MKRVAGVILLCVLAATSAHAVIVAECSGTSVVTGASCHTNFLARDGGYFIRAHPGRAFTGNLEVLVTNPVAGFQISGFYVLGELVTGDDELLHDLTAGIWKLTVSAGPLSVGRFSGSVEAGPF